MSEEYEWTLLGEQPDGTIRDRGDWEHDESRISWQAGWTPRDIMEDPILREFSEKCDYFTISKWLSMDIAIATIGEYLYIVVDWEPDDMAEHSSNSMSFRISLKNRKQKTLRKEDFIKSPPPS